MRESVERRATLAISLAALIFSLLYASHYHRKVAKRDVEHARTLGRIEKAIEILEADKAEQGRIIRAWQNWSVAVYERIDARGLKLPPTPDEAGETTDEPEKESVQPPGGADRGER